MERELVEYIYERQTLGNLWVDCLPFFIKEFPNEGAHKLKTISNRLEEMVQAKTISIDGRLYRSIGKDVPTFPPPPILFNHLNVVLTFEEIKSRVDNPEYDGEALNMQLTIPGMVEAEKRAMQKQMESVNSSLIATNTSTEVLNTKTGSFYDKQKGFNRWQKYLTGAIMLATVAYTISSIATCNILQRSQRQEESLRKIKSLINNQNLSDSILRKSVQEILETSP